MADAFRPDGRLNIPTQAAADYIAEQGQLMPYEPTMREKTEQVITDFLSNTLGMSRNAARDSAIGFTGTTDASRGGMGIGVLDFIPPFSIPTVTQEASREVDRLGNDPEATATDYIYPGIDIGFAVLESLPFMKIATKPALTFLDRLGSKVKNIEATIPRADEPLIASPGPRIDKTPEPEKVETSRRTFLKGAAATPVAIGALSTIGKKVADDVVEPIAGPVAKKAGKVAMKTVKNVGQPTKGEVLNEVLNNINFGFDYQYGNVKTLKKDINYLSSELDKAKAYFKLRNRAETPDELEMLYPSELHESNVGDYLASIQRDFGYTNDEMINIIDEINSSTKNNQKNWQKLFQYAEGDPDTGKAFGLGDASENWENWSEDDFVEKFYGRSVDVDLAGNKISKDKAPK
jgi:hypothetical protein